MTARLRRRRTRRRDTESPAVSIAKGVTVLAVVGVFIYIGVSSYNGVPLRSYSTLYADVPNIGNLLQHDPVRMAGVQVGQVIGESTTPGGAARVKLQINPGTQVPVDTQVAIRANGLLGARYVQLVTGASTQALRSGATIAGPSTALSFGVPETLETLDTQTRGALGQMINGLGAGLLGHGDQLGQGLHLVSGAAARFTGLAQTLLADPASLARLLPSLDALMTPLDQSRGEISALLAPAARALSPLVAQRTAVRDTLEQAPTALASASTGLTEGERLLRAAGDLATSAAGTLPLLPRGLRDTTTVLRDSPTPLARATALLRVADPAVPAALQITASLSPVLDPLRAALQGLSPIVEYAGPRACDIENFGETMRSMTGFGGTGVGPIGPAMEFRAQLLPTPEALAPLAGLLPDHRNAYAPPCTYLSKPYPAVPPLVPLG
jgi:virulence factor Mce-like protein